MRISLISFFIDEFFFFKLFIFISIEFILFFSLSPIDNLSLIDSNWFLYNLLIFFDVSNSFIFSSFVRSRFIKRSSSTFSLYKISEFFDIVKFNFWTISFKVFLYFSFCSFKFNILSFFCMSKIFNSFMDKLWYFSKTFKLDEFISFSKSFASLLIFVIISPPQDSEFFKVFFSEEFKFLSSFSFILDDFSWLFISEISLFSSSFIFLIFYFITMYNRNWLFYFFYFI